jgi:hypothetical protein
MLRTMMEEKHIHHDVINKLWQVYSAISLNPRLSLSKT